MKYLFSFLVLFLIINLYSLEIQLKSKLYIEDREIRIKDLIEDYSDKKEFEKIKDLKIIELDYSKQFINITASQIKKIIKKSKLPVPVINGGVTVVRWKNTKIGKEVLLKAVKDYLSEKLELDKLIDYKIAIKSLPKMKIPPNDYNFDFQFKNQLIKKKGNIHLISNVIHQNQIVKKIPIIVEVRTFQNVFSFSSPKHRYERIEINDLKKTVMETTYKTRIITKLESFSGMRTARYIPAGKIITKSSIEKIPAIRRGEIVSVVIENNNIKIKTKAKARQDGYINEIIKCQKLESHSFFKAKVVASNKVIINLEER